MNTLNNENGIEVRTVGDSRGYLWKIIIDRDRGIGKIEKVSGLNEAVSRNKIKIDGSVHVLEPNSHISDDMQTLTTKIEARFQIA